MSLSSHSTSGVSTGNYFYNALYKKVFNKVLPNVFIVYHTNIMDYYYDAFCHFLNLTVSDLFYLQCMKKSCVNLLLRPKKKGNCHESGV